jgi:hypothetical protein
MQRYQHIGSISAPRSVVGRRSALPSAGTSPMPQAPGES